MTRSKKRKESLKSSVSSAMCERGNCGNYNQFGQDIRATRIQAQRKRKQSSNEPFNIFLQSVQFVRVNFSKPDETSLKIGSFSGTGSDAPYVPQMARITNIMNL